MLLSKAWPIILGMIVVVAVPLRAQTEVPLFVADKSFDPESGALSFSITNTTEKMATAWGVSVLAGNPDGGELIHSWSEDFFLSPVLDGKMSPTEVPVHPLAPNDSLPYSRSIAIEGDPRFAAIQVEVVFAIFEDGSAIGDQREIELVFAARAGNLEASAALLELVDTLGPTVPVDRLEAEISLLVRDLDRELERTKLLDPFPAAEYARLMNRRDYLESFWSFEPLTREEILEGKKNRAPRSVGSFRQRVARDHALAKRAVPKVRL